MSTVACSTQRYDRKKVPSQLHTLAQGVDTESEVSAEDFIDQKMNIAEFTQKYLHQRKVSSNLDGSCGDNSKCFFFQMYHSRASKVEMFKYQRT